MSSVYYPGIRLTIAITEDGKKSIRELCDVHRSQIVKELARGDALIKILGDTGKLRSPDQFRNEGDGFWAIRANHVRFYGWYEPNSTFVISHVICKRHPKLEDSDKRRMLKNQAEFQAKPVERSK